MMVSRFSKVHGHGKQKAQTQTQTPETVAKEAGNKYLRSMFVKLGPPFDLFNFV